MFYKGVIFDLDNTLYDYDKCHEVALYSVFKFIETKIPNDIEYIKNLYTNVSSILKNELCHTASSHNKCIYFKHIVEYLKLDRKFIHQMNEVYWSTFYDNMECFDGVKEFFIWNKQIGRQIAILTDYETDYQLIKLNKLELLDYVDTLVTSEEVGIEKPSAQMFQTVLTKMNLTSSEVIMIGDNHEKDIRGAMNMDILAYQYGKNIGSYVKYTEFNSFAILCSQFKDMHNELINLELVSKYCGERFDLVQAGGGNTSVKVGDTMFIKASGYNLTNMDVNSGYVAIDNKRLLCDIYKNNTQDVTQYNLFGKKRGSIETYMHSVLKKYTIHLHPIQINRILVSKQASQIVKHVYPDSLVIEYLTPGIDVCNAIIRHYHNENVIFLVNHGLIVTCDSLRDLYLKLDEVLVSFEQYQNIDFRRYRKTNEISKCINQLFEMRNVSYLCEDRIICDYLLRNDDLFVKSVSFPDEVVYCGVQTIFGIELDVLHDYRNKYNESPKIIISEGSVYINSRTICKCKEIEEVLKSKLLIVDSKLDTSYLTFDEICKLCNWDAEKYRRQL